MDLRRIPTRIASHRSPLALCSSVIGAHCSSVIGTGHAPFDGRDRHYSTVTMPTRSQLDAADPRLPPPPHSPQSADSPSVLSAMTSPTLFHNPHCSKSRQALALLQARGIEPRIVRYLDTPPTPQALERLLHQLGLEPRELMRRDEPAYRELGLDDPALDRAALVAALAAHPRLIQRPILVNGTRAAIGRPPEAILEIL